MALDLARLGPLAFRLRAGFGGPKSAPPSPPLQQIEPRQRNGDDAGRVRCLAAYRQHNWPMGFTAFRDGQSRKRVPVALAVGAVIVFGSAACGGSWQGEPPCLPPDYFVSPAAAAPGDKVTVRAADADCSPRYGADARIQINVTDATGQQVFSVIAPMKDAGGFTYPLEVPLHIAQGEAAVEAYPYGVDWCDDTGRNNRGGSAAGFERASCAARTQPLNITQ